MKLFFLLSPVLLLSCKTSNTLQTEKIRIDYSNLQSSTLKRRATKGSLIMLEIANINRNQYNVLINNVQTNYFTSQPPVLTKLDGSAMDITGKSLDKQTTGASFASAAVPGNMFNEDFKTLADQQATLASSLKKYEDALTSYKRSVEAIKASITIKGILESLTQDCSADITGIINSATTAVREFLTAYHDDMVGPVGSTQSVLNAQLKAQISNYIKKGEDSYQELRLLNEQIADVTPEIQATLTTLKNKIQTKVQEKGVTQVRKRTLSDTLLILNNISTSVQKDFKKQSDIRKSVEDAYTFLQSYKISNEGLTIFNLYRLFVPENYSVSSAEILNKDDLIFDVVLSPKTNAVCPAQTFHLPIQVKTRGGFKMDFSSGLFLNVGTNDFFNQTYRLDKVAGDSMSRRIVKNENRNKVLPSIGALMHAYYRLGNDFQPSLSAGASLSAGETSRINYHFGISAILGREQRLVASMGWTLAQANILEGKYSEGQVLKVSDAPENVPTVSTYRWGHFFSLSYNLTK